MDAKPTLFAPEPYGANDPAAIVRQHPFAVLVTTASNVIHATSIPMFFERDDASDVLIGHMARRNEHVASLDGAEALAVFSGPHAYISPNWYVEKPEVPTWNYIAAHVRGKVRIVADPAGRIEILARSISLMERRSPTPWTLERAPAGRVNALVPHIVAFRVTVERIEGVTRLSQKHPVSDRLRVIAHLLAQGDGSGSEIARLMAEVGAD